MSALCHPRANLYWQHLIGKLGEKKAMIFGHPTIVPLWALPFSEMGCVMASEPSGKENTKKPRV